MSKEDRYLTSTKTNFKTESPNFLDFTDCRKNPESAKTLMESVLFMLRHFAPFREFLDDTTYQRTFASIKKLHEYAKPTLLLFNFTADTYNEVNNVKPSVNELFNYVNNSNAIKNWESLKPPSEFKNPRPDTGAKEMVYLIELLRLICQSYKYYTHLRTELADANSKEAVAAKTDSKKRFLSKLNQLLTQFGKKDVKVATGDPIVDQVVTALRDKDWKVDLEKDWLVKGNNELVIGRKENNPKMSSDVVKDLQDVLKIIYRESIMPQSKEIPDLVFNLEKFLDNDIISHLESNFGQPLNCIGEETITLYPKMVKFTRFDTENNGSFGFCDLSKILCLTQKFTVNGEMVFMQSEAPYGFVHGTFKIEMMKEFAMNISGGEKQTKEYFKVPKLSAIIRKLNESHVDQDYINDYDIIALYPIHDFKKDIYYWNFLGLDDRLTDMAAVSMGPPPKLHIHFSDQRRILRRDLIKVVYHSEFFAAADSYQALLYLPSDNDLTIDDFIKHFLDNHQSKIWTEGKEEDKIKLKEASLAGCVFTLNCKMKTVKHEESIQGAPGSMPLIQVYEKLLALIYGPEASKKRKEIPLILHCGFSDDYRRDKLGSKPLVPLRSLVENDLSRTLMSSLTDVFDYIVYNGGTLKDTADKSTPAYLRHSVMSQLPPSFMLPTILIFRVTDFSTTLELSAPFEMVCAEDKVKADKISVSTHYELLGIVCRIDKSNPLIYYPVCKATESDKVLDFLKSKKAAQVQNPAAPAKAPEVSRFSQKSNVVGYIPFKVSFGLTPLGLQDRSLREGYHRSALEDRSRTGRILGV